MKWSFIPKDKKPKYLVCNADESEPGTFKDRLLMEHDPHQLIEGCAICCWAVQADTCYIYIRGEYTKAARDPGATPSSEAYEAGHPRRRACSARASSSTCTSTAAPAPTSAARRPACSSRSRASAASRGSSPPSPPWSAPSARPTVINNVETLCNVPHIVKRGADWFKAIGTDEKNTGPKLYAISGHVERPGTYEHPIGITFREMLEAARRHVPGRARSRPSSRAAPRRRCSPPSRSTSRWTSTPWPRPAPCSARRR